MFIVWFCKTLFMKVLVKNFLFCFLLCSGLVLAQAAPASKPSKFGQDQSLMALTRYFGQADLIHKEVWWVLSAEKKPVGKSPFGKVERALISFAHESHLSNVKLSNKSLFRCDRYVVTRHHSSPFAFPQNFEIFEKCSNKSNAKKIADVNFIKATEFGVIFYPENLEEVLGLGPTILNKKIECQIRVNSAEVISSMLCQNWSQDRSEDVAKKNMQVNGAENVQMVRIDTYEYQKNGKDLIRLRGKIFQNLAEIRKIDVLVPQVGKIQVTETELYQAEKVSPPELAPGKNITNPKVVEKLSGRIPKPLPTAAPVVAPGIEAVPVSPQAHIPEAPAEVPVPPEAVNEANPDPANSAPPTNPADEGWPEGEPREMNIPPEVNPTPQQGEEPHGR